MKPVWLVISLSLLLLGISATWWLSDRQANTTVTPQVAPDPAQPLATGPAPAEPIETEVETGSEATAPPATNYARKIAHVPDTRRDNKSPVASIRDITAGNAEELLQTNLDNALDGDMASAYFVTRARMTCERFARTPEDLDRRIERTNRRVERDIKRGRDVPVRDKRPEPWSTGGDADENRANLEEWYDACQRVRSMFSPDLREQLETRALQGDVMAGYLYATWPLEQLDVGMAFEQQFRWEGLARDFSQANLDKGEVAGLIAFAQTYMNGWFTERNSELALAFAIAATNCNAEAIAFVGFLTNRIDGLASSDDPVDQQRLQFALLESERLGEVCIR
jgi:hypothetical protein